MVNGWNGYLDWECAQNLTPAILDLVAMCLFVNTLHQIKTNRLKAKASIDDLAHTTIHGPRSG